MALPTDFYIPSAVSDRVTAIRIYGGYLFRLRGRRSQYVTDAQVLIVDDPFGITLYNSFAINSSVTVTRVDGGYFWETKGNDPEFSFSQSANIGAAVLDFGASNKVAQVTVTGVSQILSTSMVISQMRTEATAEHPVDDLYIDPIRVFTKDIVAGVGFTIVGEMDKGRARGTYNIDWNLIN